MKKGFLRVMSLSVLMLAISISIVYAEEASYEYAEETGYEYVEWQPIRANVDSPSEFFFRVEGAVSVNQVNERSWFWITDVWRIWALEDQGYDITFFQSVDDVLLSVPQMEYVLETWHWNSMTFLYLDMPTMHLTATPNARIELDFYAESLMTLSWGGDARRETEMTGNLIAPGASVTLPGAPSLTAIYFQVSYGSGNPVQWGHVLLLVEVLGEDGRRAPSYSFNPQDHIPSDFAAASIHLANELGILPEFFDRSFRRPISRIEFATLGVNLHELISQREIIGRVEFYDTVDVNAQKMGFLGVMTENEFGNFTPNGSVTREQAALLITRLATVLNIQLPNAYGTFVDAEEIAGWAQDAARQVIGAGIMEAREGAFEPAREPTREEVIVMMVRLFELQRG